MSKMICKCEEKSSFGIYYPIDKQYFNSYQQAVDETDIFNKENLNKKAVIKQIEDGHQKGRYIINILNKEEKEFSGLENKFFNSYTEALHYLDDEMDFEKEYPNSMATIKMIQSGLQKGKYQIFDYPRNGSFLNKEKVDYNKLEHEDFSGRVTNEELAKSFPCHKIDSPRFFKKGIIGQLNKEQVDKYCFEKD